MPYPEVIDLSGTRQPWDYLTKTYGKIDYLEAPNLPKFRLIRVEEMQGPALCQVQVLDERGLPAVTQPICLSWPTLENPSPDLTLIPSGGTKSLWTTRGVFQRADGNGFTGFGLGSGSWIKDLSVGGPYSCFVLSPSVYSDGLAHFGWLGGTDHRGPMRLTFQLVSSNGPLPPVDGGDHGAILAAIAALDAKVTALARHLGQSL